jgi:hypothetical protein
MMTVGQRKSGTLSGKTTDFISVPIRVKYVYFGIWHREGLDSRLGNSNRLRSISIIQFLTVARVGYLYCCFLQGGS